MSASPGRRHTSSTILVARRLAEGGWTAHQIQQHLAKDGITVSWATVKTWIDDEYRLRRNRITIETKRRWRDRSGEHVRQRILDLAGRGLSDKAISVVVELYHGRDITPSMVREFRRAEHTQRAAEATA